MRKKSYKEGANERWLNEIVERERIEGRLKEILETEGDEIWLTKIVQRECNENKLYKVKAMYLV